MSKNLALLRNLHPGILRKFARSLLEFHAKLLSVCLFNVHDQQDLSHSNSIALLGGLLARKELT